MSAKRQGYSRRDPPDWRSQLRELVRQSTVSSLDPAWDQPNAPAIERLADWCAQLGFAVEIIELDPEPGRAAGKMNLVATLGSGPGGLVLAGHTDTVPFDAALWATDPLEVHEVGDRLVGLGVADMKGFFPLALAAVARFDPARLNAPVILVATADEESSMGGARDLVARSGGADAIGSERRSTDAPGAADSGADARTGRLLDRTGIRGAIIGEPTSMRPVRAHKGFMARRILVTGRSGHSSNPALGLNAMEVMHDVIGELMRLRAELGERYRETAFEVPTPTLNLGCIHGGDNPNRICGACELSFDLRLLPGMAVDDTCRLINARLDAVARRSGAAIASIALAPPVPAWSAGPDSAIVRAAEALTGTSSESVAFATESPFLARLGLDTVVLGAGSIDAAHQPDEFLPLASIEPMIEVITGMIRRYCVDVTAV